MRLAPLAVLLAVALAPAARAQGRWQLDFEPGKVGTVTLNGTEGPGTYLYFTGTVSNHTGREIPLRLSVTADTDVTKRSYRGSIDPVVRAAVERKLGKQFKSMSEAAGPLADGASVEILVTLGKVDASVRSFDINIAGLVDRIYHDRGRTLLEERVLTLKAARPGDEFERQNDIVTWAGRKFRALAPAKEIRKA